MVMLIMMILSLHLGELGVLCAKPDVAVRLSHMVPPENHFHPHLVKKVKQENQVNQVRLPHMVPPKNCFTHAFDTFINDCVNNCA